MLAVGFLWTLFNQVEEVPFPLGLFSVFITEGLFFNFLVFGSSRSVVNLRKSKDFLLTVCHPSVPTKLLGIEQIFRKYLGSDYRHEEMSE